MNLMAIFSDYKRTVVAAHIGWWGTLVFALGRATELIPVQYGTFGLLLLGLGVTASLALSRYRLTGAITDVFNAGMKAALTLSANVFTDTCIAALDEDGHIVSVDHADAIGWEADAILGKDLVSLLVPRSHGTRILRPGTSMTSPMYNSKGDVFDARVNLALLDSGVGDQGRLVATISPVVTSSGSYEVKE